MSYFWVRFANGFWELYFAVFQQLTCFYKRNNVKARLTKCFNETSYQYFYLLTIIITFEYLRLWNSGGIASLIRFSRKYVPNIFQYFKCQSLDILCEPAPVKAFVLVSYPTRTEKTYISNSLSIKYNGSH